MQEVMRRISEKMANLTSDLKYELNKFLSELPADVYDKNEKLFRQVKVLDAMLLRMHLNEAKDLGRIITRAAQKRKEKLFEDFSKDTEEEVVVLSFLIILLQYIRDCIEINQRYTDKSYFTESDIWQHDIIWEYNDFLEKLYVTPREQMREIIRLAGFFNFEKLEKSLISIDERLKAGGKANSRELQQIANEWILTGFKGTRAEMRALEHIKHELLSIDVRLNDDEIFY